MSKKPTNWNNLNFRDYDIPNLPDAAFAEFKAMPGKAIVEMCLKPESSRGMILPDIVSGKVRADVGVVLSCAPPKSWWDDVKKCKYEIEEIQMDVRAGDVVLVRPDDGQWMMGGWSSPTYTTKREIRLYGIAVDESLYQVTKGRQGEAWDTGEWERIWWSESLVARVVGNDVHPTSDNIIVRPKSTLPDFLHVPDGTKLPTTECIVEKVSRHSNYRRGERLCYMPDYAMDLKLGDEELYIVRESQILALVGAA